MGEVDDFVGCKIKRDLTNITLKIYQPHIINNMIQWFKEDVKSLITSDTPTTPHKVVLRNQ